MIFAATAARAPRSFANRRETSRDRTPSLSAAASGEEGARSVGEDGCERFRRSLSHGFGSRVVLIAAGAIAAGGGTNEGGARRQQRAWNDDGACFS